jgi:phosphoglycolate phosphatase
VYEVLNYYKDYYAAHSQIKTRPYEGILEALNAVRKEYPVAIVSNKPDNAVKILCAQYFGDTYALGESDTCPRKPAPDMVHKALKAIGAETCVYVGDSEVDVLTARNAGMPCLSVLWGFRDQEILVQTGATHFCENPADLLSCLKEMI